MMSIVDQTDTNHPFLLVLVYSSGNNPLQELVVDLKRLLQPNITTIVIGDFNFSNKETNVLTKFLKKQLFTQVINWPTHREGGTIDHCYVSNNARVQVTRHSPYYSDHDALCIQFEHFPWY